MNDCNKIEANEVMKIRDVVEQILKWLEENSDLVEASKFEEKLEELNSLYSRFADEKRSREL